MSRPRVIAAVLVHEGALVRTQCFSRTRDAGDPLPHLRRLGGWDVDEVLLLDASGEPDLGLVAAAAFSAAAPLACGGGIRDLQGIADRLAAGAHRCVLTSAAVRDPRLVARAVERFGAHRVTVGIDVAYGPAGAEVMLDGGVTPTGLCPVDVAGRMAGLGVGELMVTAIDRDGCGTGVDIGLMQRITRAVTVPVVARGGVAHPADIPEAIRDGGADGVAVGTMLHLRELAYPLTKRACLDAGLPVRAPRVDSADTPRDPWVDPRRRAALVERRFVDAGRPLPRDTEPAPPPRWCERCVARCDGDQPLCAACRAADARARLDSAEWSRRTELLIDLLERHRGDRGRPDCVLPVVGEPECWHRTHFINRVLGFTPLLVAFDCGTVTPEARANLSRLREEFDADLLVVAPALETATRLSRLAFIGAGDPGWPTRVGFATAAMRVAVQQRIPVVVWGEHPDPFAFADLQEFTYRDFLMRDAAGLGWEWFVGLEGLRPADLGAYRHPDDRELLRTGVRGVYLSNHIQWDPHHIATRTVAGAALQVPAPPSPRTHRTGGGLGDLHEHGVRDWMRHLRTGSGVCTDHVGQDIRAGRISRERGLELTRAHEAAEPADLVRWLARTGVGAREFVRLADTFRSPSVWWRERGTWRIHHALDTAHRRAAA